MNFLVTVGVGFIGSHFCEGSLEEDPLVCAFDNLESCCDSQFKGQNLGKLRTLNRPFEFVEGDITRK